MECQFCKEKQATIHIEEVSGNESRNINICDDCALKHNVIENYLELKLSSTKLQNLKSQKKIKNAKNSDKTECAYCGYHITDYFDTLSLSCPHCYDEFRTAVKKTIKNIHSKSKHKSDYSKEYIKALKKEKKIKQLEVQLNNLVLEEEYEQAAFVRDIINKEKKYILEKV